MDVGPVPAVNSVRPLDPATLLAPEEVAGVEVSGGGPPVLPPAHQQVPAVVGGQGQPALGEGEGRHLVRTTV